MLRVEPDGVVDALQKLLDRQRQADKELQRLRGASSTPTRRAWLEQAVDGVVVDRQDGRNPDELRDLAQAVRGRGAARGGGGRVRPTAPRWRWRWRRADTGVDAGATVKRARPVGRAAAAAARPSWPWPADRIPPKIDALLAEARRRLAAPDASARGRHRPGRAPHRRGRLRRRGHSGDPPRHRRAQRRRRGRPGGAGGPSLTRSGAGHVVVGLPLSLDGRRRQAARGRPGGGRRPARRLVRAGVTVETFDERFTTVSAERSLRGAGHDGRARRERVDQRRRRGPAPGVARRPRRAEHVGDNRGRPSRDGASRCLTRQRPGGRQGAHHDFAPRCAVAPPLGAFGFGGAGGAGDSILPGWRRRARRWGRAPRAGPPSLGSAPPAAPRPAPRRRRGPGLPPGSGGLVRARANPGAPGDAGRASRCPAGSRSTAVVGDLARQHVVDELAGVSRLPHPARHPRAATGRLPAARHDSFGAVRDLLASGPNVSAVTVLPGFTVNEVAQQVGLLAGHGAPQFLALATSGTGHARRTSRRGPTNLDGLLGTGTYLVLPGETDTSPAAPDDRPVRHHRHPGGPDPAGRRPRGHPLPGGHRGVHRPERRRLPGEPAARWRGSSTTAWPAASPLQMDSTVLYSEHRDGGPVTSADLALNTPYNTYLHTGLTPTPICFPSEASLRAALAPTPGDWLYFVVVQERRHRDVLHTFAGQQANERLAKSRGLGGERTRSAAAVRRLADGGVDRGGGHRRPHRPLAVAAAAQRRLRRPRPRLGVGGLPGRRPVHAAGALAGMRALGIAGLSVTMPHKQSGLRRRSTT